MLCKLFAVVVPDEWTFCWIQKELYKFGWLKNIYESFGFVICCSRSRWVYIISIVNWSGFRRIACWGSAEYTLLASIFIIDLNEDVSEYYRFLQRRKIQLSVEIFKVKETLNILLSTNNDYIFLLSFWKKAKIKLEVFEEFVKKKVPSLWHALRCFTGQRSVQIL